MADFCRFCGNGLISACALDSWSAPRPGRPFDDLDFGGLTIPELVNSIPGPVGAGRSRAGRSRLGRSQHSDGSKQQSSNNNGYDRAIIDVIVKMMLGDARVKVVAKQG